jgi:hypothetical protein
MDSRHPPVREAIDMNKRLQALGGSLAQFVKQHRPAVIIVGAAVALLAAWRVVMALSSGGPAPAPVTTVPRPAVSAAPHPPAPLSAEGANGAPAGGPPASGGTTAGGTGTPGVGRPDPFSPLAGQIGSGTPHTTLPPVPPLSPNALGASAPGGGEPGAPGVSASPTTQFHLTGILDGQVPVAILNDASGSYIVAPGDTVVSGVRLVAVDADAHSVTLSWNDQSWQVRLAGGGTTR